MYRYGLQITHVISDNFGSIESVDVGDYIAVSHLERLVSTVSYNFTCYNFSLQVIHLIPDFLRFIDNVDIANYLVVGYLERSVLALSYIFSCFLLVCNLYESGLQIRCIILDYFGFMDSADIGDFSVLRDLERSGSTLRYFFSCCFSGL